MNANELKVFLRHDGSFRDDPGSPLDKPFETITIDTSSETFLQPAEPLNRTQGIKRRPLGSRQSRLDQG
jgi:hypothetical protein